MKPFILFLKIAVAVFTINATPQSLVECSDKTSYWVIPDDNCYYTIKLKGDIGLSRQHDILNVNEKALQYVLLDKNRYSVKDSNDESVLLKYTAIEAAYLRGKFSAPSLNINTETITLSSGKSAILWYFELPEGKNTAIVAQIFASTVLGNKIFGLGSPLFSGEDFDTLRLFLLDALNDTAAVISPNMLCKQ